jgi:hypothetical protein
MSHVKYKREGEIWKGSLLGVAKLRSGKHARLRISCYGGFFKIYGDRRTYYVDDDKSSQMWIEMINGTLELFRQTLNRPSADSQVAEDNHVTSHDAGK